MSTTLSTLAGLQESIVADSTAMFRTSSDLFNAVYTEDAGSAITVNFSSRAVPAVISGVHVELVDVDATAVTITQVPATLGAWPILARASKISLGAPNASLKIAEALAGGIARSMDTAIAALCSGFTDNTEIGTEGTATDVGDFFDAAATLDATGFVGQKVAIYHPKSFSKVGQGLLALQSGADNVASQFMGRGYVATIAGVEIYVSPWASNNGTFATNGMYFKEALGLGYRTPVIDIESMPNLPKVAIDFLGTAYFVVTELSDGAGIRILDLLG